MVISLTRLFKGYFKLCECNCGYLIPCVNKMGNFARFKHGHNNRGKNHWNWKGGKSNQYEYNIIYKPFFKYSNSEGYVREHRYIMYIYLSILNNKVIYIEGFDVHHKNGDKKDNHIENLELLTRSEHTIFHNKIRII